MDYEKEKIFKKLDKKHVELLSFKYDIKPELLSEQIKKLLVSIAEAGKFINDEKQRKQLESYARYWDLFLYQNTDRYQETLLLPSEEPLEASYNTSIYWGEAPSIEGFQGRIEELHKLKKWIIEDNCQVLTLLGMGGIGKTFLARKLVEEIKEKFDKVFWIRLINAPKSIEVLKEIIKFLSNQQKTGEGTFEEQKSQLLNYLQNYKCLIVLDNIEAILEKDNEAGQYKEGYEDYEKLIHLFGKIKHQSCLLLTSREKPKTIAALEKPQGFVYSCVLDGLEFNDAKELLQNTFTLEGSEEDVKNLIDKYQKIPLYLELVAKYICEVYNGKIDQFLNDKNTVFGDLRDFLDQHYNRLSAQEKEIMNWLVINRDPISLSELKTNLLSKEIKIAAPDIIQSLKRRTALVENSEEESKKFSLQPVLIEYVTERLIKDISQEIKDKKVDFLRKYAFIQAQAKDYVRESQIRCILEPIADRLKSEYLGEESLTGLKKHLEKLVSNLRKQFKESSGYGVGNIINLSRPLGVELTEFDFSCLQIWQADLRNIFLHGVNFSYVDLQMCAFPQTFGSILSVAFSPPNNELLATSTATGEIYVWQVKDRQQLKSFADDSQHTQSVWDIAFSPDGKLFASGDDEGKVKIWDVETRECLNKDNNFKHEIKHETRVWSVAFGPDSKILATGSGDGTVKFWDVSNVQNIQEIENKRLQLELEDEVRAVAFNPINNKIIAVAHGKNKLSLRDIDKNQFIQELKHSDNSNDYRVWSVAFSRDGKFLASGSEDGTVKLWNAETGIELHRFQINRKDSPQHEDQTKKHNQKAKVRVQSVAFSPISKILVSGSDDNTIRFWDIESGKCLKTESEHKNRVWSVAFSSDGKILASGSDDRSVKIWDIDQFKCLYTWQGRGSRLLSLAFPPCDLNQIVSGGEDGIVRVWDIDTGKNTELKDKHTGRVWTVAFSPDPKILATGSDDCTIKLWDLNTGRCFRTLKGHSSWVWSVSFSLSGNALASASDDKTVKIWDVDTGEILKTLDEYKSRVWTVAFNPKDENEIATGDEDNTVQIWNLMNENPSLHLGKHKDWVRAVSFSNNGQIIASASEDGTIKLWDTNTNGKVEKTLEGHKGRVWAVAFSSNNKILASGGDDNTVKLWNVNKGDSFQTLDEHQDWVRAVTFSKVSKDGQRLASASEDGTIQIYELEHDNNKEQFKFSHYKSLKTKKPYESLKIWGITSLTPAQKKTLIELGAVDRADDNSTSCL